MGLGLTQYALRFLADEARFRSAHTVPVLIWEAPATSGADQPWMVTLSGAPAQKPQGEALVFEVRKGSDPTNAFAMGITVGRAPSNDISLEDESVSRFHAYLQQDARSGQWRLSDAESRNGTWLGAEPLPPSRAQPVTDRTRLRFGAVEVLFLMPESLFSYLEGRLEGH